MPARLLLLCLLFRSSWLTVEGGRGRRRHSAASPGRTGSRGRVGGRGCWRSEGRASGCGIRRPSLPLRHGGGAGRSSCWTASARSEHEAAPQRGSRVRPWASVRTAVPPVSAPMLSSSTGRHSGASGGRARPGRPGNRGAGAHRSIGASGLAGFAPELAAAPREWAGADRRRFGRDDCLDPVLAYRDSAPEIGCGVVDFDGTPMRHA